MTWTPDIDIIHRALETEADFLNEIATTGDHDSPIWVPVSAFITFITNGDIRVSSRSNHRDIAVDLLTLALTDDSLKDRAVILRSVYETEKKLLWFLIDWHGAVNIDLPREVVTRPADHSG